jgi:hypothetical protein
MFTVTLEDNGRWLGPYGIYYRNVDEAMNAAESHIAVELLKEKANA